MYFLFKKLLITGFRNVTYFPKCYGTLQFPSAAVTINNFQKLLLLLIMTCEIYMLSQQTIIHKSRHCMID